MTEYVDVAVVGAGPAGLQAALVAARSGAAVCLVDAHPQPGGQYYKPLSVELNASWSSARQQAGRDLWNRVDAVGVRLLSDTVVWGLFEDGLLGVHGLEAPSWIQAQAVVLATGAYDRPVAFPGWTLPGVITTGAAQGLLHSQRILPGRRIVLAGTGPLQLVVAAELVEAGAEVVAVLEGQQLLRRGWRHAAVLWGQWSRVKEGLSSGLALLRHEVPFRQGWGIVEARGDGLLTQVVVARLDGSWRPIPDTEQTLDCDVLCVGYGFVPSTELSRLAGADHRWRPALGGEVPIRNANMETTVPGIYAVGDGASVGGAPLAMIEGQIAGFAAAARSGHLPPQDAEHEIKQLAPALERERRFQQMYAALFTPGPGLYELARDDTVICRCEDTTQVEVLNALKHGAAVTSEVKAITRCGMGACQGRVCAQLVARIVARHTSRSVPQVGLLQPRPPVFPLPLKAFSEADLPRGAK